MFHSHNGQLPTSIKIIFSRYCCHYHLQKWREKGDKWQILNPRKRKNLLDNNRRCCNWYSSNLFRVYCLNWRFIFQCCWCESLIRTQQGKLKILFVKGGKHKVPFKKRIGVGVRGQYLGLCVNDGSGLWLGSKWKRYNCGEWVKVGEVPNLEGDLGYGVGLNKWVREER